MLDATSGWAGAHRRGGYLSDFGGLTWAGPQWSRTQAPAKSSFRSTVNAASEATTDEPLPVDHLANIHQVLRGERRVRTQVVLTRLAELNSAAYEGWSYSDLKTALADEGIEIGKSHGRSVVRDHDVTHDLTESDENDNGKSDDDVGI